MSVTRSPLALKTGEWIRSHRQAKGWSQYQLSQKMRTRPHVTSISDWERGDNQPSARHLAEISRVFNERPPVDGDDEEESEPAVGHRDLLHALAVALEPHLNRASA